MRPLAIIAPFIALIGFTRAANYGFDTSCDNSPNSDKVKRAFAEAIKMAGVAAQRIGDAGDQDTEDLFQAVWKVPRSQEQRPRNVFSTISALLKTSMTVDSDSVVWVFCDNDKRFIQKTDKTSGKTYWWDKVMKQAMAGDKTPLCRDANTLGVTYSDDSESSITICDLALNRPYATMQELIDTAPDGNVATPSGHSISDYAVISRTALHELTHAFPARTYGVKFDHGYKWSKIYPMAHDQAIENADSYAYFGLISFLKGFKLSTDPDQRKNGMIVKIPTSKRRSVPAHCRRAESRRSDPDCLISP